MTTYSEHIEEARRLTKSAKDRLDLLKDWAKFDEERASGGEDRPGAGPHGQFGEHLSGGNYNAEGYGSTLKGERALASGDFGAAASHYKDASGSFHEAQATASSRIASNGDRLQYERGKNITGSCHDAGVALSHAAGAARTAADNPSEENVRQAHFAAGIARQAVKSANDALIMDGRQG